MAKTGTALIVWRKHYIKTERKLKVRTVCEVLRELYRDAQARDDKISMVRLEEAHDMAKRMQMKLFELQPNHKRKRELWTVAEGRAKFEEDE
jgi:uncharacterized membrane protein (DUF106 family)